jgi:glutamate/tyrosine decarboxylase-like PLP-dependent enzyme
MPSQIPDAVLGSATMIGSDPHHTKLFDQAARYASAYRDTVGERPQRPELGYGAALQLFEEPTPERGMPAEKVIDELVTRATPGLHTMTGPRFFGWVIGASHPVGVAADFLTSAWGQNSSMVVTPASAAVEAVVTRWLLDLLDLPREASVGFTTGATTANLTCLAAARGEVLRRVGWDVEANGLVGAPPVHVLVGADAHAVVFSALQLLGLGHDPVIRVPTDDQGRIVPSAFAEHISACEGPTIGLLQAGHLNTGAFDPMPEIAPVAHARGAWIHVDGAFGLWARACPERADVAATNGSRRPMTAALPSCGTLRPTAGP